MADAIFIQDDGTVDYTPASDVVSGEVVVRGVLLGVATRPIASGELGALSVEGVFDFAKAIGATTAITAGSLVYWDDINKVGTETATSNTLIGKSVADAADGDATVRVRVDQ